MQPGSPVSIPAVAPAGPPRDAQDQLKFLLRNAAEVVPVEELATKLERSSETGRPLRVKLGLDPTAGHVTLGWAVVLRKMREFQDLGHTAVLIVGDFTARVGDPSGKTETRPRLSKDVVQANAELVLGQFDRILSKERLEIRYNSEWLEAMDMEDVLKLTSLYTVARMLERDDFAKRFAEGRPISIMEFFYPLFQAMDSVAVQADLELGGSDQKFNLLVGRDIQKDYGQEQQVAFTMPLLVGLDGVRVMGQSLGNYVGITEPPEEMFGKLMSLPDEQIVPYFLLLTDHEPEQLEAIARRVTEGGKAAAEAKRRLAREVAATFHGPGAGQTAEERFDRVHKDRELPEAIPEVPLPDDAVMDGKVWLPRLLPLLGLATSNGDARRLILQGAVRLQGEQVRDPLEEFRPQDLEGKVIQVGRRKFVRLAGGADGQPGS